MVGRERYPHVFAPIRLGPRLARNRIVVPAHTTNFGEDHLPSDRHLAYHAERARGGVGIIIFEGIRVHSTSVARVHEVAGYDPRCVEPFRRLAETVRAHGALLFGQLLHMGRHVEPHAIRAAPWAPSPIPWSPAGPIPHAMTVGEIAETTEGFVRSARHLLEAGLDGIEVHLGHGHLLQQFLSPASNHRTDAYGGSEENRLRFPLAVVRAVREAVGDAAAVGIRISADEFLPDGLGLAEMRRLTRRIADRVRLDFIHVSHSAYHTSYSMATQIADMHFPPAAFRHLPAGIKAAVPGTAIVAVCRINRLSLAEEILSAGEADLVAMARAHIADPFLVRKTLEGREAEVRPCIACNQGCIGMIEARQRMTCMMNPVVGREREWGEGTLQPVSRPRRILVVGGGPGGLEAARVAALRGHRVHLWERDAEVGGQVNVAALLPARGEFTQVRTYLEAQCREAEVEIACGVEATPERVLAWQPDAVVLATGAVPRRADFPGGERVHSISEALRHPGRLGRHVVVIDGDGTWQAVGTAEALADLGLGVTVITAQPMFGWRITMYSLLAVPRRFREKGVRVRTLRAVRAYDGNRLVLEDVTTGQEEVLEGVDGVVGALGGTARDDLSEPLRTGVPDLHLVGDCFAPRTALEAVFEGHAAGRAL